VSLPEPLAVLVVGHLPLADLLAQGAQDALGRLEIEHTADVSQALEFTRVLAPDVVVLDADMDGAAALSQALAQDPIAESTPVIVVGTFARLDEASTFTARGAARTLTKPASPEALLRAVQSTTSQSEPSRMNESLGLVSVDELADRLAQQVKTGLLETIRPESRTIPVDLGRGTEVLAAVWSAIARVRELLTMRSDGAIRFAASGPIGAVPVAPWLDIAPDRDTSHAGGASEGTQAKEPGASFPCNSRRILVVDDDPAVTWFLSGLFRTCGCIVKDAPDGERALELAFRFDPDLVVTDILMPKLDGFGLCRALKRDILLRDVPVIVLSWKEDLLQRVRELGVGADGYLRKKATSDAILRTARECLTSRTRIEQRLHDGGVVRGRLDGLTARTLIGMTTRLVPNATLAVRDANHLFEVQIRDQNVVSMASTARDGSMVHGEDALTSLLRVRSGRFLVTPCEAPVELDLPAPFDEMVALMALQARAAQAVLDGAILDRVRSVSLNVARLALDEVPQPARVALQAIADGTAPSQIVRRGLVPASVLEQLFSDAIARRAVVAVFDTSGKDLLAPEVHQRIRSVNKPASGKTDGRRSVSRTSSKPYRTPSAFPGSLHSSRRPARTVKSDAPIASAAQTHAGTTPTPGAQPNPTPTPAKHPEAATASASESAADSTCGQPDVMRLPSSLAEALFRTVGDTNAEVSLSAGSPSMLDASDLRLRSMEETIQSSAMRHPSSTGQVTRSRAGVHAAAGLDARSEHAETMKEQAIKEQTTERLQSAEPRWLDGPGEDDDVASEEQPSDKMETVWDP